MTQKTKHKYSTYVLVLLIGLAGFVIVLGDWDDTIIDGTDWLYSEDGTHVTTNCYYFIVNNTEQKICNLNNKTYYNNNNSHYFTGNNFTSWSLIYALQGYLNQTPTEPYMIATKQYVDTHAGFAENTSAWNMTICIEGTCNDIYAGYQGDGSDDGFWSLSGCYIYNNSGSLDINQTCLNATIEALSDIDTDTNTFWPLTGYLYNNSGSADINETMLNQTIDNRNSDTTYNSDEIYIYESSNVFYLNETKLNATIEALDTIGGTDHTHNQNLNTTNSPTFINLTLQNINHSTSGIIRTFQNGCIEIANTTGLYTIC